MGSSSNSVTREARASEAERQAGIDTTTGQINALYDSPARAAQRTQYGNDLRNFFIGDANRQKGVADRNLRFAMARSGLTGGSATIDANKTSGEDYQRGILESERRTQQGVADLLGRDEQSRLTLTGLAQGGLNATNAANQAAAGLRTNIQSANADARLKGLGDIFDRTGTTVRNSWEDSLRRDTNKQFDSFYKPYYGPKPYDKFGS